MPTAPKVSKRKTTPLKPPPPPAQPRKRRRVEPVTRTIESALSGTISEFPVSTLPIFSGQQQTQRVPFGGTPTASPNALDLGTSTTKLVPEIVAVSRFVPIYEKSPDGELRLTDAGRFIESIVQSEQVRGKINSAAVGTVAENDSIANAVKSRRAELSAELAALLETIGFLSGILRSMRTMKEVLEIKSRYHTVTLSNDYVSADQPRRNVISAGSSSQPGTTRGARTRQTFPATPPSFNVFDVMEKHGYDRTVLESSTSTKLWLLLIDELKESLRSHTSSFGGAAQLSRTVDADPTIVVIAQQKRFALSDSATQLPQLEQFATVVSSNMAQAINLTEIALRTMYESESSFSTFDSSIAARLNVIAREFRCSVGLSRSDVVGALKTFSYDVEQQDNAGLFDAVCGTAGSTIDSIDEEHPDSLVGFAHKQINDSRVVATFESQPWQSSSVLLVPGSEYYVDSVLDVDGEDFRVENLEQLSTESTKRLRALEKVISGLGLIWNAAPVISSNSTASAFSSTEKLVELFFGFFTDGQTGSVRQSIADDPAFAVFAASKDDRRLRALLFLLTVLRLAESSESDGNVQFVEELFGEQRAELTSSIAEMAVDRIDSKLRAVVPGPKNRRQTDTLVSVASIEQALRNGTDLMRVIERLTAELYSAFTWKQSAIVGGATRLSGLNSATVMLMLFDVLCAVVSWIAPSSFVGSAKIRSGASLLDGLVLRVTADQPGSVRARADSVRAKLDLESSRVSELVYSVTKILRVISTSADNIVTGLRAQQTSKNVARIRSVLGDDAAFSKLCDEQQIMLMHSFLRDVQDALTFGENDSELITFLDVDVASSVGAREIRAAFSSPEFATVEAYNKRVLTFGIPRGTVELFKQYGQITNNQDRAQRELDLIRVSVHKIDAQHSDLVFKPVVFLFELSQFVARHPRHHKSVPAGATLAELTTLIPFRDHGTITADVKHPGHVTMGSRQRITIPGRPAGGANVGASSSVLDDEDHSFLTQSERREIIQNHVVSYLVEVYVKFMTGLSLADHHFRDLGSDRPTTSSTLVRSIITHRIQRVVSSARRRIASNAASRNVIAAAAGRRRRVTPTVSSTPPPVTSNQSQLTGQPITRVEHEAIEREAVSMVSTLSSLTSAADPLVVSGRILTPKHFDRVFSVIVDPDEFEIDEQATASTAHGRRVIDALLESGEVTLETIGGVNVPKQRDGTSADLAFERYFVTIEPF